MEACPKCEPENLFSLHADMYGLLTKCEVKMAGYWSSSFFACLLTEIRAVGENNRKEEQSTTLFSITERKTSIQILL